MDIATGLILAFLMSGIAAMYASVGQAGASGYIAMMALWGLSPAIMRPVALILNLTVSIVGTYRYARAGLFRWSLYWPFVVTSIPMAFVGGRVRIAPEIYRVLIASVLLYSAYRLIWSTLPHQTNKVPGNVNPLPRVQALLWGAGIGFIAGITGIGGGIFLSPLLHLKRWAEPRQVSALSSAFILVNSASGLAGQLAHVPALPGFVPLWITAVLVGGYIGAGYGSQKLDQLTLKRILAGILIFAALRTLLA